MSSGGQAAQPSTSIRDQQLWHAFRDMVLHRHGRRTRLNCGIDEVMAVNVLSGNSYEQDFWAGLAAVVGDVADLNCAITSNGPGNGSCKRSEGLSGHSPEPPNCGAPVP